jgi:hypothetical protein
MDIQEIDIFIEKDGQVRLEVRGVKGPGCLTLTSELEKALGGDVSSREMRPDAYEIAEQDLHETERQGF